MWTAKIILVGNQIFLLDLKDFLNIVFTVSMNTNQWEKRSWKTAYAMVLMVNGFSKWVSSQLFVSAAGPKVGLRKGISSPPVYIGINTSLTCRLHELSNKRLGWVTKPSQVPSSGNLPICQEVIHFHFVLSYSRETVKSIIFLYET